MFILPYALVLALWRVEDAIDVTDILPDGLLNELSTEEDDDKKKPQEDTDVSSRFNLTFKVKLQ